LNKEICKAIEQIVSASNVLKDEPMSRHTTFRTGGPASLFIRPDNEEQLIEVMNLIRKLGIDYFILGNGSNLLVSDEGFDGIVISLGNLNDIHIEGKRSIYAGAGAMNSQIAAFARDNSLKNFEFAFK